METAFNYLDDKIVFFSSDERKWINKLRKLADEHPDECQITVQPENNDGCINARFPAKWLKIAPPIKRNMTDEQRAALSERAKNLFGKKDSADEEETEDDE